MNHFVTLEFDPAACKPVQLSEPPMREVTLTVENHPTSWLNGQYRKVDAEDWKELIQLARTGADKTGWCTICETTIGNGNVIHEVDCLLYDPKDTNKL